MRRHLGYIIATNVMACHLLLMGLLEFSRRHFLLGKCSCKGCYLYVCENKPYRIFLFFIFPMYVILFSYLDLRTNNSRFLWKLTKNGTF